MNFIDFITNFEQFLPILIQEYGAWVYAILFLIIFSETAFVFMFFLPGDSLLLTVGALCSVVELMHLGYMITLLTVAATLGYIVNYSIGRHFGNRIFEAKSRFIKKEYLNKTNRYFLQHGGKTILLARFIPFARSFAPPRCWLKQYELWKIFDLQCGRSYFMDLYPLNGWLPIWPCTHSSYRFCRELIYLVK